MIEKEEPTEEAKQRAKNYMSLKGALEPKQETLEEASWIFNPLKKLDGEFLRDAFVKGAKWQQERMYSEEEVKQIITRLLNEYILHLAENGASGLIDADKFDLKQWFSQNKKK